MFEKAVRQKLRFDYRGVCSVEDLWDLSVQELDLIYKQLNGLSKAAQEESLLQVKTKESDILDLKIEIVKHIVTVKVAEAEAKKTAKENKIERERLMSILNLKKEAALQNLSEEEIQKRIDALS